MKRRFTVYASSNRSASKSNIVASHLSDKYEEPAYGFRDLPHSFDAQSDAFANTSLDSLNDLWNSMTWMDQAAVEYATSFMESDGYDIKNLRDIDLETYARQGCSQVYEGNSEPEYENEDWYEEEADFDTVFNYLKAKRDTDDLVIGSTDIVSSEGQRSDNDWLLKPGNSWYAVASYYDYGDAESGPMVGGDWIVYQASTPEEAKALCKRDYPDESVGDVRLATPDEIEEYYYILREGDAPDHIDSTESGSTYSYGGLVTNDEEDIL